MTDRQLWVLRHGETAWSRSRRHTGRTDVPLTERGREMAGMAGRMLHALHPAPFWRVVSSPLSRAADTAALAGYAATTDDRLLEWNYGDYEGLTTVDIRAERPDWQLWRDGCPAGEQGSDVAARIDSFLDDLVSWRAWVPAGPGDVADDDGDVGDDDLGDASGPTGASAGADAAGDLLVVAHSHLLRVLAARWLGLDPDGGALFVLDPAHVGALAEEHQLPAVLHWNLPPALAVPPT